MSKSITSNDDKSVWAVIMPERDGVKTTFCDTEKSAQAIAWFHRESRYGRVRIIELPLIEAEVRKADGDETFDKRGSDVSRRHRK